MSGISPCDCPGCVEGRARETPNPVAAGSPPDDPWAHRSKGMRCATCMWYAPKVAEGQLLPAPLGRCRRHAPTMNGYPAVFPTDWCGDHKLDEAKL